ncbi:MAG: hypothetical protein KJO84_00150 [Acidimicrobiia bacterium]|nr:hypothetical protein [Acidimicrobiia bacterium]
MTRTLPKRSISLADDAGWVRPDVGLATRGRLAWRGLRPRPADRALLMKARSVHTFGMAGPLRVAAIDPRGIVISSRIVAPGRVVWEPAAGWILEIDPADPGPAVGATVSPLASWR